MDRRGDKSERAQYSRDPRRIKTSLKHRLGVVMPQEKPENREKGSAAVLLALETCGMVPNIKSVETILQQIEYDFPVTHILGRERPIFLELSHLIISLG